MRVEASSPMIGANVGAGGERGRAECVTDYLSERRSPN
jgi:hypothetical protein